MRPRHFLVLCVLYFTHSVCFASPAIEKHILDNGLTVLVSAMPTSEIISIYAYVKTGSAAEGEFSGAGISHFIEHMLFKGTVRRPPGAIAAQVKALGGNINASTGLDYTMYTIDLPKGTLKEGLDIINDMIVHSVFDSVQVDKEREVIHGEMRLYNDRPDRRLSENVFRNVYIRHPYRHPIIGYKALFDHITRDELYGYYRSRYIPNNIILSVAGAIDPDEAMVLIQGVFKDFQPMPYPERNLSPEPPQIAPRYFEDYYPTPMVHFSLAYQGVPLTDPDLYALDVLAMALGQGESSRLYHDVYKAKHLVEQIRCSNFTPQDKGVFEIEGVMTKDNLTLVRQAIKAIIEDVRQHGLLTEELAKTKRQVLSQFVFAGQTSSSLAYRAATDEGITGDPQFSQHYVEAVKNVTNEDIKRAARRYLVDAALSVTVLKPKDSKMNSSSQNQEQLPASTQRIVFDNGLTLLLKEDHRAGVVAVEAVVNAGVRQETVDNNGISELFSRVWAKGTGDRTEEWIAQEMERRGGSLGAFAGRNTAGIKAQVLADDLMFALDVLAGLIQNPSLTNQAIQREKEQMSAAIDARQDDVRQIVSKQLMETLYLKHPCRLDPLGSKESLGKITRGDILDYYRRFVQPNNMVISIFGDFDSRQVLAYCQRSFSRFKKGEFRLNDFHEPPPQQTRVNEIGVDKEQAVVMFGFQAPAIKANERWGMEVIDTILGAGLSGRLFVKIRDELGKAYTVGSQYTPGIDIGTIALFVLTTNDKVDSVKEIVKRELQDMRDTLVSDEELKSAKAHLKGTFKMGLATPEALGTVSALNELYGLGYNFHEEFDARVDAVTKEDVRRLAGQYLDMDKAAVVIAKGKVPTR